MGNGDVKISGQYSYLRPHCSEAVHLVVYALEGKNPPATQQ